MPNFTPRSGEGGWGAARADLTPEAPGAAVWNIERARGAPADLHRRGLPVPARRLLRWCEADRAGLVLGSAQPESDVDAAVAAARGVQVVRRRSGGSAVLVGPGEVIWADVVIPRDDPLWSDDVGLAPLWVGAVWAKALGLPGVSVHRGAMRPGRWGWLVCFGGVGPGEVLVDGRKVVGISQRRTREAALFQCAALTRWDPADTLALLRTDDPSAAAADLRQVAAPADPVGLEAAFELALAEASFEVALAEASSASPAPPPARPLPRPRTRPRPRTAPGPDPDPGPPPVPT